MLTSTDTGATNTEATDTAVAVLAPSWQHHTLDGELAPGHIHVWVMDLARMQDAAHQTLLTPDELARGERRVDREQRAMYLGGRIGMRTLLCAYTGIANENLRFSRGARGKPGLSNRLQRGEFCFNYTLSGNKALYALAWNRQVGIDMETYPRKINAALLAKRKLATVEQRAWHALPDASKDQAMLACWTRKEAYGKVLGVGIRYALNRVPMFVDLDSPTWQCAVGGLFEAPPQPTAQVLHGIQLALPFPGVAALVYAGDALESPADGVALQARQLRPL